MQLNISEFRKRNTYESIAEEITNPKEKIERAEFSQAKQFKETQQGSRFDDNSFLGLENDHNNRMKQQQQQMNMQAQAEVVGISVVNASRTIQPPTTQQAAAAAAPINPKHSKSVQATAAEPIYHDMSSGDRELQEQEDMEEAIRASKEIEQNRKKTTQPN